MTEINEWLSEKIKNNAVSAYLMIFISWLFLLNKVNPDINNSFVKAHTKSAMIIHFWFLITYIIFISNSLFSSIAFMWFALNDIITNIIYIGLLILLVIWIYKAHKWEDFAVRENINISKSKTLLDINWDWEINEKDKLTILLSFVPLIGFINFAKFSENKTIQEAVRLNILVSLFIILLYIFSYSNLANLFSLAYIILVTFIWINLFTREELISIKLPEVFSPNKAYIYLITIKDYLVNYFDKDEFKWFDKILNQNIENKNKQEKVDEDFLSKQKDFKLPKFLIYIPIINLIFIFYKGSKYSYHIVNSLIITLLLWLTWLLSAIWYFNVSLHLLAIFPILFWIWYTKNKLAYQMPIIFDIYVWFKKIFSIFKFWSKKLKEKRMEENEISLKVEK